ncbi:ATP synthase subunit C [Thiorhodospira sibirica]|uniref:ATP synthase subunit C n=1 Tax=Thiorhodospira sibirica TaxID=154347 RepID=UPI00022C0449|nr:ATP synthase subunit C [Thiorhodospira sibirica]
MYWVLALMTVALVGMIAAGIYYDMNPPKPDNTRVVRRMKGILGANLLTFVSAQALLVFVAFQQVMASDAVSQGVNEISIGMGLAMIGAGIPTAFATVGAGIAVGPVGSAAIAAISEKPEIFGRSLVYLGLAEGIAIYGLVVTILMLGAIG